MQIILCPIRTQKGEKKTLETEKKTYHALWIDVGSIITNICRECNKGRVHFGHGFCCRADIRCKYGNRNAECVRFGHARMIKNMFEQKSLLTACRL